MCCLFLLILVSTSIQTIYSQESAQYLQNAVRDLRHLNFRQTLRRADTKLLEELTTKKNVIEVQPTSSAINIERRHNTNGVPPLSLTKGELAALYESAIAKGETIKLNTGDKSFVHAAVAELDDSESKIPYNQQSNSDDPSGYYYYYYPLKSFMEEMTSQPSGSEVHYSSFPPKEEEHDFHHHPDGKPHYQYHSHHHQHNVNITPMKKDVEEKKPKPLEPLFMAISGFIGMALMFVLSMVVFPKLGIDSTKLASIKKNSKHERITDIARVALSAIEGQDCTERFACELGKTARSFNLQENRFVKLLRRMAPITFGKQIDKVGRYSNKKLKCTAIPCKKKNVNKNAQKKNSQNAHKKS